MSHHATQHSPTLGCCSFLVSLTWKHLWHDHNLLGLIATCLLCIVPAHQPCSSKYQLDTYCFSTNRSPTFALRELPLKMGNSGSCSKLWFMFKTLVHVQNSCSCSKLLFMFTCRFRRTTHVTPKSYLSFLGGYKTIYLEKRQEIAELVHQLSTGLEKLEEAQQSIHLLSQELVVKEKELEISSLEAEKVLKEVSWLQRSVSNFYCN